ncbi:MAG TPA: GMC family oxidoreductase N-terminal domain-containing protein [Novosphingobium sp.]|nr:GMC family oxidoreductase N-terminal domain-containing protein [Novosphingobium sp.]
MSIPGYDYVIVGAGSAGCVLANRLSEDPAVRVLLVEAGGSDRHPLVATPLAFYRVFQHREFTWAYQSEPEPHANGRVMPLWRGKVLGGSSSINGMTYTRGHPSGYDDWARLAGPGWSYDEVLPYFRRAERSWRGEGPYHGASGPLAITHVPDDPFQQLVFETARNAGYAVVGDINAEQAEGFCAIELTVDRGRRASTAQAYLRPAIDRPNLTVLSRAHVTRVTIEHGRASGIAFLHRGKPGRASAACEVIVSAGAYNSPQLLMLSGIGNAEELRRHGIAVAADLPGVGRSLVDHVTVPSWYRLNRPLTLNRQLRADRAVLAALSWMVRGDGMVSRPPFSCWQFLRTRPDLSRPDVQSMFSPISPVSRLWFPGIRRATGEVFSASNTLLYPASRGRVTIRSADPVQPPRVLNNFLACNDDVLALRNSIKARREFCATAPMADHVEAELLPGPKRQTDEELDAYIRKTCSSGFHPCGTCAMGKDGAAVLDERLRVRGIDGLRVIDASAMPQIVGGNINAAVIMMAERGADLIKADRARLAAASRDDLAAKGQSL